VRIRQVPLPARGLAPASPREVPRISYSPVMPSPVALDGDRVRARATNAHLDAAVVWPVAHEAADFQRFDPVRQSKCVPRIQVVPRTAAATPVRANHGRPRSADVSYSAVCATNGRRPDRRVPVQNDRALSGAQLGPARSSARGGPPQHAWRRREEKCGSRRSARGSFVARVGGRNV
jgi:hypothetical protein